MNTLLLQPTDVLFFRDGRPMGGSLAGHGAAWPLPNVTDAALHAALHRAEMGGYKHRRGRGGVYSNETNHRDRTYGSLVTAGPFPVGPDGTWYLPRPLDLSDASLKPTLLPTCLNGPSSLPAPLTYAAANTSGPSKDTAAKPWLSQVALGRYLSGNSTTLSSAEALDDHDFSDTEATIGIGIDPDTQTQDGERIYSAHYLRLREGWRLGLFAKTDEKSNGDPANRPDLIPELIKASGHIIVGGQQRVCTATLQAQGGSLPLPRGLDCGFAQHGDKHLVKWVMLTPGLWPEIEAGTSRRGTERDAHPGGWLPTWVCPTDGHVLLRLVDEDERRERRRLNYASQGYPSDHGGASAISARLVAALVPKPIVVTGWELPHEAAERPKGGAKSTHLAVQAGAVYYFETESAADARSLATALNWHGASDGSVIKNRRSTLLGEKGFGLGVCGTWQIHGGRAD
jgi:hypothetical protein